MKMHIPGTILFMSMAAGAQAGLPPAPLPSVVLQAQSVSSSVPAFNASFVLNNVIDPNGLTSPYVNGVTLFSSYVPFTQFDQFADLLQWQSATGNTSAVLTFDFGARYNIDGFAIWNSSWLNGSEDSDVNSVHIYSDTDADFGNGTSGTVGSLYSPIDSDEPHNAQIFSVPETLTRYLHLDISSIVEGGTPIPGGGTSRTPGVNDRSVGFSDIVFRSDGVAVVPVPAAVWLMGSGLLALIGFRRRAG